MTQPPRIEAGTTRLFSVQYSANPMAAPYLNVLVGSAVVAVTSVTANSAATAYNFQQTYTMPVGSDGVYAYRWTAAFSSAAGALPDITRGLFQVVTTVPWATTG